MKDNEMKDNIFLCVDLAKNINIAQKKINLADFINIIVAAFVKH